MAHLITGYRGEEHIQSADQGSFNASFFGTGQYVMEAGNQMEAAIIDNNTVRVSDGDILMKGRHIRIAPNTYEDLTIDTGTAGKNRIDLIVMRYEKNNSTGIELASLVVVKGSETEGTPMEPSITDGDILAGALINDMPLYKVRIEGVVLTGIEKKFSTLTSFGTLAAHYEQEFIDACNTYLGSLNILDTKEEIQANTQKNQLAGALVVKDLVNNKQDASSAITTSNIGSQSVNYATSAGSSTKATKDESGNNIKASYASSLTVSGTTVQLKNKNGEVLSTITTQDTNTWRGIQNNLTSTSTTDSLSAAQGRALANGSARDDTKLPLSGGTMSGHINVNGLNLNNVGTLAGKTSGMAVTFVGSIQNYTASEWLNIKSGGLCSRNYANTAYAEVIGSKFNQQSSRRYKENIEDMTEEYAKKLLALRPVSYDYKNKDDGVGCFGLIAEEVAEVEEYPVSYKNGQVEGLDYSNFVPQLIKMIQIQQKEIDALKEKIEA